MTKELIARALKEPPTAIAYGMHRALAELYAGRCVLETTLDLELFAFARAGHAQATLRDGVPSQILTSWAGPEEGLGEHVAGDVALPPAESPFTRSISHAGPCVGATRASSL